jgi:hypothetical protein
VILTRNAARLVVLLGGANAIASFNVSDAGELSSRQTLTGQLAPVGGAPSAQQPLVAYATLSDASDPRMVSVRVLGNSAPRVISSLAAPADVDPCWAAASPGGKRVWSSNFQTASLTLYRAGLLGKLTRIGSYVSADGGPGSLDVALDRSGHFLYRLRAFNAAGSGPNPTPRVEAFRVGTDWTGADVTLLQSVALPSDLTTAAPTGIAVTFP